MISKLINYSFGIYEKIKFKILQKNFSNIEDCIRYCDNKNFGSYDNEELSKYSFDKFIENKDNFKTSYNNSHKFLLEVILLYLYKHNKLPKILDIGGVFGENKVFLDFLFQNNEIIYDVVETRNKVKLAKNLSHSKFYDNIDEGLKNDYDFIFSSSTLQYFKNPYEALEKILDSKKKYIGFTRGNFHPTKNLYIAQVSKIKHNGPGEGWIKKNYSNKIIFYHNTAMSYKQFKDYIYKKNYKVIRETQGIEGNIGPNTFQKNFLLSNITERKEI